MQTFTVLKTAFPHFFFHLIFHYVHFPSLRLCPLQISFTRNCTMPKQLTTKRKAEGPDNGQEAMPTKKLQKASSKSALNSPPRTPSLTSNSSIEDSPSSKPALNIPPRPASATDSSLSESPLPPSLTSDSSIEDLPSSTSMLQETRLNHGSEQETKMTPVDEFYGMNLEQLKAYG